MEEPLRQIAGNAGLEGSIVVEKIKEGKDGFGYNAATDKYEDLIKAGVIDPKKVTRTALQNAASVAGLLLTTECAIADKPEKKRRPRWHARRHGRGMGGDGRHGRHVLSLPRVSNLAKSNRPANHRGPVLFFAPAPLTPQVFHR